MELEPKNILKRHENFPKSSEKLIENYAYSQYKQSQKDLMNYANVVHVENTNVVLICVESQIFDQWQSLKGSNWHLKKCFNLP